MKNQIATYVRRNPFTVLFFDEIEKAHLSVQQALLGILDAGTMTYEAVNGSHKVVKTLRLKNTSVFMATNAGQNYITNLGSPELFNDSDFREAMTNDGLDEFMIDRMERVVPFFYITKKEFGEVLKSHLRRSLTEALKNSRVGIKITNSDKMAMDLADKYFKPQMSNREASRIISYYVRDRVTEILFGLGGKQTELELKWSDGKLQDMTPKISEPQADLKKNKNIKAPLCRQVFT